MGERLLGQAVAGRYIDSAERSTSLMKEDDDSSKSVLLVISQGDHTVGVENSYVEADGREMGCEEWEALVAESYKVDELRIHVNIQLLSKRSTYFKGCLNFSESSCERLNVEWILPIFCNLLQCIHGCHLPLFPFMVAPLIQGAAYFGVEDAITKCENWMTSRIYNSRYEDDFLSNLYSIWLSATEHGIKSIGELCVQTLAINFAWAMRRESFLILPLSFLEASINHPELTIKSEMDLCNALLLWYENQDSGSPNEVVVENPLSLFKKVQLNLLPIYFILRRLVGKYPLNIFHTTSATSSKSDADLIYSIIDLQGDFTAELVRDYMNFKPVIRLTKYSKELDLSCCHQISCHHLIAAAAQVTTMFKNITTSVVLPSGQELAWPGFPVLNSLKTLNLSHCWRIEHRTLLTWLKLACPDLLELRAPHCGQLLHVFLEIVSSLSKLAVLDFSEIEELTDIVGAVTRKLSLPQRTSPRLQSILLCDPSKRYNFGGSLQELSLRGRSELADDFLLCIARSCLLLTTVDFSGCTGLSDKGLADFLNVYHYRGLRGLSAAGTRFGLISCRALINSDSHLRYVLETLDLCKCSALGSEDLSSVLRALSSLVFLALAFTRLNDMALSAFFGTSLRHLNLRETKVSGEVLSQVLARNANLKDLNIRGCTQLALYPYDSSLFQKKSEWENVEVGWGISDSTFSLLCFSNCKLENLAIGVGGTISGQTLLRISEECPKLKRLSLSFQIILDEDLIRAFRNLKSLQTLELQNMACSSRTLLIEIARSLSSLKMLKLERVMPWLSDDDLLLLSQSFLDLQGFSLLGCQRLTNISLPIMAYVWRGLRDLRLEECQHLFTQTNVWVLLESLKALKVLHLRHIGKVLPENFIVAATRSLPSLQKLAIDFCDAIDGKYTYPEEGNLSTLKSLYLNRCQRVKDFFHGVSALKTETTSYYSGRTHKDTIVLEWNSVRLKESVVSERLTFE